VGANQISIEPGSTPSSSAISATRRGTFFKILDCALGLRMMERTSRELAIAHGPQFPAERLLGDRDPELLEQPLAKDR